MSIAAKLKAARLAAGITQEQAAEVLGVSRQTVSNWETGKTYPDILSVVRLSELYDVSLDHLLKGTAESGSDYLKYLDESTNTVRSQKNISRLALVLTCLGIWALSLIVFWCFTSGSDAMAYSIMFLWLLLPVTIFVASYLLGKSSDWGREKWCAPIAFGVLYMLAEYATFSAANMAAFEKINPPQITLLFSGSALSLIALALGFVHKRIKEKKQE